MPQYNSCNYMYTYMYMYMYMYMYIITVHDSNCYHGKHVHV